MHTTLEKIREHSPCTRGWTKLLAHLGKAKPDSTPLPLSVILESNGLEDTLWCLRAVDGFDREKRLYSVWCARQVEHLLIDPRSLAALEVAERFANGGATVEDLTAARDAAWAAAVAAGAAARAAAVAAGAAWAAARAAVAADDAAAGAADAAAWAAWAAGAAAVAARAAQVQELKRALACTEAGIDPYPRREACSQQD